MKCKGKCWIPAPSQAMLDDCDAPPPSDPQRQLRSQPVQRGADDAGRLVVKAEQLQDARDGGTGGRVSEPHTLGGKEGGGGEGVRTWRRLVNEGQGLNISAKSRQSSSLNTVAPPHFHTFPKPAGSSKPRTPGSSAAAGPEAGRGPPCSEPWPALPLPRGPRPAWRHARRTLRGKEGTEFRAGRERGGMIWFRTLIAYGATMSQSVLVPSSVH